jgi:plastocyanin
MDSRVRNFPGSAMVCSTNGVRDRSDGANMKLGRLLLAILTLTSLAALHGCRGPAETHAGMKTAAPPATAPSTRPAAAEVRVVIGNFSFTPSTVTVPVGAAVIWTNRDDVPHTVTSTARAFGSPALDTDDTFSIRFDRPGTYPYYCAVHPHMTGQIIVK